MELMTPFLEYEALQNGFNANISYGGYGNILEDVLGKNDLLDDTTNYVMVFLNLNKISPNLSRFFASLSKDNIEREIQLVKQIIDGTLLGIQKRTSATVIWHTFELPTYPSYGIIDNNMEDGHTATIQQLNKFLRKMIAQTPSAYLIDMNACLMRLGSDNFYDPRCWYIGSAPYTNQALASIVSEEFKIISALSGNNKKCLVLDCDGVLWGGVIGEDGLANIKLGQNYPGNIFCDFQKKYN